MTGPLITLTTDFGLGDAYVGVMKGVILGINPEATLVDLSHDLPPQNVLEAAFVLSTAVPYFPPTAIHLVVVDPGVGTSRRPLVLRSPQGSFVGPDNGVFSFIIGEGVASGLEARPFGKLYLRPLPRGYEALALTARRFWLTGVSQTFHGRDIFAPVAAHLSLGVPLHALGRPISSMYCLHVPAPRQVGSRLSGHIVHIDRFGNLTTTFKVASLPSGGGIFAIAGHSIAGLSKAYAEGDGLMALGGSSGYVELALRDGSAAAFLGAQIGDVVTFEIASAQH